MRLATGARAAVRLATVARAAVRLATVAGLTVLCSLALSNVAYAQQAKSGGPVFTPFVGTGSFATFDIIDNLHTTHSLPFVGVGAEFNLSPRLRLAPSVAAGASLQGCSGSCPSNVVALDVSALWLVTSLDQAWGIHVGPGVAFTHAGVSRTGAGGSVSAGVRRGFGPRLTIRTHAMFADEVQVTTRAEFGLVLTR